MSKELDARAHDVARTARDYALVKNLPIQAHSGIKEWKWEQLCHALDAYEEAQRRAQREATA